MRRVWSLISLGLNYFGKLNSLLAITSGMLIISIMFIVSYEVIMRYYFDSPTTWVVEVSIYLIVSALFIPQAYAQQTGQHVRMDWLFSKLPERWQARLDIVNSIIGLFLWIIFSYSMLRYALKALRKHWTSGTSLDPPMWPVLTAMAVGAILLCLQILITIGRQTSALSSKQGDQQIEVQTNTVEGE